MKIAFVLFSFQVLCSNGSTVPTRTTRLADGGHTVSDEILSNFSTDAVSNSEEILMNIDLTGGKINESEIFENGQAAKKDHERSYIYIKNIKSRLPWFKSRGSLFSEFGNAKVSKGTNQLKSFKANSNSDNNIFYNVDIEPVQVSMSGNQNITYLNAKNRNDNRGHFSLTMKEKNQMGVQGLRYFASKDKTTLPPKFVSSDVTLSNTSVTIQAKQPVKNYYLFNGAFNVPGKNMPQHTYWKNGYEHQEIGDQQQRGQHYKMPVLAMSPPTVHVPILGNANTDKPEATKILSAQKSDKHENVDKVDKYITHIIRDDHIATSENKFNCFNRDCTGRSKTYRVNMNNGILQGSECMCIGTGSGGNSPFVPVADRDWRVKEKPVTVSEKSFIRSITKYDTVSTEADDSYETLLKETKKLSKIVERME